MSAADVLREWLDDYTAAKDGLASAKTRMLAQDAEIARLRARVDQLESDLGRPITTSNAPTKIIYTGEKGNHADR